LHYGNKKLDEMFRLYEIAPKPQRVCRNVKVLRVDAAKERVMHN
jgi:hypothetical protein